MPNEGHQHADENEDDPNIQTRIASFNARLTPMP